MQMEDLNMSQYKRTSIELSVGKMILNDFVVLRIFASILMLLLTVLKQQICR